MATASLRKGQPARAATKKTSSAGRAITPEDLLRFQFVSDPQVSPDGTAMLFSKKQVGSKNDYTNNIWIADTKGGAPRQLTGSLA